MEIFDCYHGTDGHFADIIIKEKKFNISEKESEWAGSGIYFFISDDDSVQAKANALKWARRNRTFSSPTILRATVKIENKKIFDLRKAYDQSVFEYYSEAYFRKAATRGATDPRIRSLLEDASKLDCFIINKICDEYCYKVVIKQSHIIFESITINGFKFTKSFVSNSTIFCLRDSQYITDLEECSYG